MASEPIKVWLENLEAYSRILSVISSVNFIGESQILLATKGNLTFAYSPLAAPQKPRLNSIALNWCEPQSCIMPNFVRRTQKDRDSCLCWAARRSSTTSFTFTPPQPHLRLHSALIPLTKVAFSTNLSARWWSVSTRAVVRGTTSASLSVRGWQ